MCLTAQKGMVIKMKFSLVRSLVHGFYCVMFNIKVEGLENIPTDCGVMITPNHTSNWDPALIGGIYPGKVHFMAKAELFKNKLFGALLKALGAFPIARGDVDLDAIKKAIKLLRNNETVIIFPHGRRIGQGEDVPIKEGAVMIALRSRVKIVPVYISGEYKFRHKIIVRFGEAVDYSEYAGSKVSVEKQRELSDELWGKMKALRAEN